MLHGELSFWENLKKESRASREEGDMQVKAQARVNTVYLGSPRPERR